MSPPWGKFQFLTLSNIARETYPIFPLQDQQQDEHLGAEQLVRQHRHQEHCDQHPVWRYHGQIAVTVGVCHHNILGTGESFISFIWSISTLTLDKLRTMITLKSLSRKIFTNDARMKSISNCNSWFVLLSPDLASSVWR